VIYSSERHLLKAGGFIDIPFDKMLAKRGLQIDAKYYWLDASSVHFLFLWK